mgnify:CR=1 FL=1
MTQTMKTRLSVQLNRHQQSRRNQYDRQENKSERQQLTLQRQQDFSCNLL